MLVGLNFSKPAEQLQQLNQRSATPSAACHTSSKHGRKGCAAVREHPITVCKAAQAPIIESGPPPVRVAAFEGLEPDDFRCYTAFKRPPCV